MLVVLTFAARWHTDLRDVLSFPLSATIGAGLLAGGVLIAGGVQDGHRCARRRFIVVGGLLAAGAVALLFGGPCWWRC